MMAVTPSDTRTSARYTRPSFASQQTKRNNQTRSRVLAFIFLFRQQAYQACRTSGKGTSEQSTSAKAERILRAFFAALLQYALTHSPTVGIFQEGVKPPLLIYHPVTAYYRIRQARVVTNDKTWFEGQKLQGFKGEFRFTRIGVCLLW